MVTIDRALPWRRDAGTRAAEIEPLVAGFKGRQGRAQADLVTKAWEIASGLLTGQVRRSGEACISHPLAVARIVAEHLSTAFKQQFFVETRAGASGTIGVQSVVNSAPDGYNFVMTTSTLLVLLPASNPKLGYHPTRDLTNIAYLAGTPIVISVAPQSGASALQDLIALSKKTPKPLSYSSSGLGSSGHLVAELLAKLAGMKIEHVPYRGGSQSLTDLLGGHIAFASQTLPSTAGQLKSGALTALAHSGKERLAEFPNVQTLKEQGFDIVSTTWYSLSGPAGLPDNIVQKINREIGIGQIGRAHV